jgi:hypothetical protein
MLDLPKIQHKVEAIADLIGILKSYIESQSNVKELLPLADHVHSELVAIDELLNEVNHATSN